MGKRRKCKDKANCFRRLELMEKTLDGIALRLERAHFGEYIEYVGNEKRVLRRAFRVGLIKGIGSAIGFTVLGAAAIYVLRLIARLHLPYIADLVAEIIRIIESRG